jgi:hypothetical protein
MALLITLLYFQLLFKQLLSINFFSLAFEFLTFTLRQIQFISLKLLRSRFHFVETDFLYALIGLFILLIKKSTAFLSNVASTITCKVSLVTTVAYKCVSNQRWIFPWHPLFLFLTKLFVWVWYNSKVKFVKQITFPSWFPEHSKQCFLKCSKLKHI